MKLSQTVSKVLNGRDFRNENSAKNVDGVTVVNLSRRLVMIYISTKFCEIILNGIKVIEWPRFLY